MTSEIRANTLKNRVGLGTVSFTNTGPVVSGIVTIANSTSEGVRLEDNAGVGGSLKITTPSGYVSIGAGNAAFVHLNTDRGSYYFQKRIIVDEGIIGSYDENLTLQSPLNTNRVTINKDTGLFSILNDLDVDGHTNLDNVSVAGVTTFSGRIDTDRIIAENSSSTVPTAKFTNLGTGNQLELHGSDTSTILIKATNNNGTPKLQLRDNYDRDNFISVTDSGDNLVLAVDEGNAGADSTMLFRVDGTERLRITSGGGVYIGNSGNSFNSVLGVHKAASNAQSFIVITNNTTGTTTNDGFVIGYNGSQEALLFNKESTPMRFATDATERLRITSNGHIVTQGLTGPSFFYSSTKVLEVSGNGTVGDTGVLNISGNINSSVTVGAIRFNNRENTASSSGSSANSISIASIDVFADTSDSNAGNDCGGFMRFITKADGGGNAERLRITSDGKMGVNTNNPQELLHVNGTTQSTDYKYTSHPGHAVFTGDNSTTSFTIQSGHSVNSILVVYNGAVLTPTTDYTVSGTTLTMNGFTPPTNAHICVRYLIK
tara:strand:- start:21 stop:1652 length:1632 start_codon:yes stop_codon:yes gene_type:complete